MIIIMLLITLPHHSMYIHRQWWPPTAVGWRTLESGLVVFVVPLCFLSILKYFLKFVAILRHVAFALFTLATVSPSSSSRVRADRAHHNHSGRITTNEYVQMKYFIFCGCACALLCAGWSDVFVLVILQYQLLTSIGWLSCCCKDLRSVWSSWTSRVLIKFYAFKVLFRSLCSFSWRTDRCCSFEWLSVWGQNVTHWMDVMKFYIRMSTWWLLRSGFLYMVGDRRSGRSCCWSLNASLAKCENWACARILNI